MLREESFDSFYQSTRRRAAPGLRRSPATSPRPRPRSRTPTSPPGTTGARSARLEDRSRLGAARAWQLAQRRHAGRIWHRNKGITEEHRRSSTGWPSSPAAQRRALLLVELAGVPLTHAARELGVTPEVAERNLRRPAPSRSRRTRHRPRRCGRASSALDTALDRSPSPAAPIVRRAGHKRRQATPWSPRWSRSRSRSAPGRSPTSPAHRQEGDLAHAPPAAGRPTAAEVPSPPTADNLLDQDQIRRLGLSQRWEVTRRTPTPPATASTRSASRQRFADPDGLAAIVREFGATSGKVPRSAVQTVEISESSQAGQGGLPHHARLVRRVPARPPPAARRLPGRTTSAPRPTCS